jgi:hypothetical protein
MRQVVWPFMAIIGVSMSLMVIIFALPYFGSVGIFDSTTVNAINSARTGIQDLFPFLLVLVVGGIVGVSLSVFKR